MILNKHQPSDFSMKILVSNTLAFIEVEASTERKMTERRGWCSKISIMIFLKLEFGLMTLDTVCKLKATTLKPGVASFNLNLMMMAAKSSALSTLNAQGTSSTMIMINAEISMDLSRVTNLKVLTIIARSNQLIAIDA